MYKEYFDNKKWDTIDNIRQSDWRVILYTTKDHAPDDRFNYAIAVYRKEKIKMTGICCKDTLELFLHFLNSPKHKRLPPEDIFEYLNEKGRFMYVLCDNEDAKSSESYTGAQIRGRDWVLKWDCELGEDQLYITQFRLIPERSREEPYQMWPIDISKYNKKFNHDFIGFARTHIGIDYETVLHALHAMYTHSGYNNNKEEEMKKKVEDFSPRESINAAAVGFAAPKEKIIGTDWEFNIFYENGDVFPKEIKGQLIHQVPGVGSLSDVIWTFKITKDTKFGHIDLVNYVKAGVQARVDQIEIDIDAWLRTNYPNTTNKTYYSYKKQTDNEDHTLQLEEYHGKKSEQHEPFTCCNSEEYEIDKRHEIIIKINDAIKILCELYDNMPNGGLPDNFDAMLNDLTHVQQQNVQRCLALKFRGNKVN